MTNEIAQQKYRHLLSANAKYLYRNSQFYKIIIDTAEGISEMWNPGNNGEACDPEP